MGLYGVIFRGICMGIKTRPAFEEGGEPTLEIGIAVPKVGGFPGEQVVHAARLTREQSKAGLGNRINSMIDKPVEILVELNQGKTDNGRSYSHYRLASDPVLLATAAPQQLKSA